jgi:hypothetical protein
MRMRVDFNKQDVKRMLTEYFSRRSLKVQNLDKVCEDFAAAYKNGLSVDVDTIEPDHWSIYD